MVIIKKIWEWVKNNRIDFISILLAILGVVCFILRLIYEIKNKTSLQIILEMAANYVTIMSCVIVLIQLFAFVADSRHKELRCRKEAALDIAQKYADDLLDSISLIQNVLSVCYDDSDFYRLEKVLSEIKIDRFTKRSLNKISSSDFKKYNKMISGKIDMPFKVLFQQSLFFDVLDLNCLEKIEREHHKSLANRRFSVLINKTMNTLEYFAMSVNQNVAESDMLFSSLHQTYLKFVKYMYPRICELNVEEEKFFPNVIQLYRCWQEKLEKIEAEKEAETKKAEQKISGKYSKNKPL